MKCLNLYAGLGGNRKLWADCEVTAVEINEQIAGIYSDHHPKDEMVIGDAHEYLRKHHTEYDFIWSSPPCPTHSKMAKATRHQNRQFPSMVLYEEILFLEAFFDGLYFVENVVPFFDPLVTPSIQFGRHLGWCNFPVSISDVPTPPGFINATNTAGAEALKEWLGIHYEGNIYHKDNHCPAQVLRNCVHPDVGLQVYEQALGYRAGETAFRISQGSLFT